MIKSLALAVALLTSASVFAQSGSSQLVGVEGQILVNGGEGFQIAVDGTALQTGYLVSVAEDASGYIAFEDGCRYVLQGGTMVTVPEGSPCAGFVVNVARIAPASSSTAASGSFFAKIHPLAYVPIAGVLYGALVEGNGSRRQPPAPISP